MADQTDDFRKLHSAGLYFDMGSDEDEEGEFSPRDIFDAGDVTSDREEEAASADSTAEHATDGRVDTDAAPEDAAPEDAAPEDAAALPVVGDRGAPIAVEPPSDRTLTVAGAAKPARGNGSDRQLPPAQKAAELLGQAEQIRRMSAELDDPAPPFAATQDAPPLTDATAAAKQKRKRKPATAKGPPAKAKGPPAKAPLGDVTNAPATKKGCAKKPKAAEPLPRVRPTSPTYPGLACLHTQACNVHAFVCASAGDRCASAAGRACVHAQHRNRFGRRGVPHRSLRTKRHRAHGAREGDHRERNRVFIGARVPDARYWLGQVCVRQA